MGSTSGLAIGVGALSVSEGESAVLLSGEIAARVGPNRLAGRLARAGLRVEVGDSCQFEGGRYLRVHDGGHLTLERIGEGEYLARGDADSVGQMSLAAARLSRAPADLGVRHRFEVHDGRESPVDYLHHLWPRAEGPDSPGDPADSKNN